MSSKGERGKNGGYAAAASMTTEERIARATKAATARWSRATKTWSEPEWTDLRPGHGPWIKGKRQEMEDKLIVTVELSSGKFHSKIQVPLFASDEDKQAFIDSWLQLIELGIKAGRSSRENQEGKSITTESELREALRYAFSDTTSYVESESIPALGAHTFKVDATVELERFASKVMGNLKAFK